MKPRWSVVLVVPRGEQFVVIAKGFSPRDINFPGGDEEPGDRNPRATGVRELSEETGLITLPKHLKRLDTWEGDRGQAVYAFFVTAFHGRLRSSDEGKSFWTSNLTMLTGKGAQHAEYNKRLLVKLMRLAA